MGSTTKRQFTDEFKREAVALWETTGRRVARAAANRKLLGEGRRIEARHSGRYGSPRVHAELRAEGHRCSRGRVARWIAGERHPGDRWPAIPADHHRQPSFAAGGAEPAPAGLSGRRTQSHMAR